MLTTAPGKYSQDLSDQLQNFLCIVSNLCRECDLDVSPLGRANTTPDLQNLKTLKSAMQLPTYNLR